MRMAHLHRTLAPLLAGWFAGPLQAAGPSAPLPSVVELRPAPGLEIRYRPGEPARAGRLESLVSRGGWKLRSTVLIDPEPGSSLRVQRLDTGLQVQGPLGLLVLGDTLASGGGWSRPVRLGGLRLGRPVAVRPEFDARPEPVAAGASALPARPFGFAAGRQPAGPASRPPSATPLAPVAELVHLAAGQSDHEFEAGRLRSGWGSVNDRYGQAYAAFGLRRGLGGGVTAEGRGEWTPSRQAVGLELARSLAQGGGVAALLARSEADRGAGLRAGMRLAAPVGGTHWRLAWDGFDPDWTPVGAAPDEVQPRMRLRASAQAELARRFSAGLSLGGQSAWNAQAQRVLALSLRWALPRGSSMALNISDRSGTEEGWQHRLVLDFPLDRIGR